LRLTWPAGQVRNQELAGVFFSEDFSEEDEELDEEESELEEDDSELDDDSAFAAESFSRARRLVP
jgi:hypothetical protein